MIEPVPQDESLLLDVGVPFRMLGSQLHIEAQAHHGMQCWLRNFRKVTLCAPVVPEWLVDRSMDWVPTGTLLENPGFAAAPLPWGYGIQNHARHASAVRRTLRGLIPRHRWLCYGNLGWLGAWGRLAAEESFKLGRPFSIWLDWALHQMPMRADSSSLKRLWRKTERGFVTRLVLRDVRRASLGLFNGKTVFDAYSGISKNPKVVHDIHLTEDDIIPADRLQARLSGSEGPLRILYVGRVHEMKGPRHWLDAVAGLVSQFKGSRKLVATWIGDGPLLDEMRKEVVARNLSEHVFFTGIERDRSRVLAALREADLFAFCHLTPESPRVLIEALMSGLPIVGFSSSYALDLLGSHTDGGSFVAVGDSAALAARLTHCLSDPDVLRRMSEAAHSAGKGYSDVQVFKHRSDLIKEFL
jgi:glycosyltransferase involved in cell wall biosynthesis